MTGDPVEGGIRELLAEVLGLDAAVVARLPGNTPLFNGLLGLGSLTGVRLLAAVDERFGVDVVAEDLTLACLESIDTLATFVRRRTAGH